MSRFSPRAAPVPAGLAIAPVAVAGSVCRQGHGFGDGSRTDDYGQAGSKPRGDDRRLETLDHRM